MRERAGGESMATNVEVQVEQKKRLYQLLTLKKDNEGLNIKGLNELIKATKAEMQQEDVAWVEKMVAED
jgi:hypothetical protein